MKLKNNKRQLPFPVLCLEESVFRNALFEYNFRKSKNKKDSCADLLLPTLE